ncbi:head maturation protease, ClpP-related [Pararhodobacter sp. CCB-MM2]|uniref:head maturation protease, ClpP-related n=1 Tax=Pararhodobacter sp. CCB-MM2 TaxID=1786003 RepID=UPI00082DD72C|nr:head maturation protease, ClpP-related [Pararhodobacter sp. CCB-MM2]
MSILVDGELVLYGFVGDDWWGEGFTASQVVSALAELGRDADITVRINSGGGYTDDGIAIFNALRAHRGTVAVVVDAMAASAASLIAMAGDSISMRAGSLMMIHDPAGMTWGNAADHEKSLEVLNKLADVMADIYAERTGEDPSDIREEMKATLWLTPAEAVERGFATEVETAKSKAVAAFDYRLYDNAPQKLVAMATRKDWSFKAEAARHPPNQAQPAHVKETPTMATKTEGAGSSRTEPPQQQAPATFSAADVKARIKAITSCEAASGRQSLAEHLAFDTDMPTEAAIAVLTAAAGDAPHGVDDAPQAPVDAPADPKAYQARRTAASDLAQPVTIEGRGAGGSKTQSINMREIYARRNKQEA